MNLHETDGCEVEESMLISVRFTFTHCAHLSVVAQDEILAAMHDHEQIDLKDDRLRRWVAQDLGERVSARQPELARAAHHGALDGPLEPEHGALHGQRSAAVLAGGEHERDGRQVPRAHLQARADDDGLVPAEEL